MDSVTVIVGAGASIPLGVPGTVEATDRVLALDDDPDLLDLHRRGQYEPPFRRLRSLLSSVYESPNFEHLLHALETVDGLQNGRFVIERCITAGLTNDLKTLFGERHSASLATAFLIDELHKAFADASDQARRHNRWPLFCDFWHLLSAPYRLDVVTFNYDTCLDSALPGVEQGFRPVQGESTHRFDPSAFATDSVPRLMHLHGCVRFGRRGLQVDVNRFAFEDSWHDMYLYATPEEAWQANRGSSTDRESQAGRTTIVGHLITGLQKTDKLIAAQPYLSYYQAATRALCSSPRVLIIGYGFSDLHINAWLQRLGRLHGDRLRLCILDYAPIWESTGYRHAPQWARSSLILHLAAQTNGVDMLAGGIIQAEPWMAANGRCRLDLRGFLATAEQASEVIHFLESG